MRSGGLPQDDRNRRTAIVGGFHLGIAGRRIHMNLVNVSRRPVVMMVAIGVARVDVEQRRLGIEPEEGQTKKDCDRPHSGQVYLNSVAP